MSIAALSEICEFFLQIIEMKDGLGNPQTCTCQKLRAVLGTVPSNTVVGLNSSDKGMF